ncbi:MAG: A/G-specific adenine glycosylase [Planctomycetes bacterium RBG_13_60_9]|nr:MAG: A/G-specific adenine glycosylase [Planctomycetes bacterium RBG_13_60_9]
MTPMSRYTRIQQALLHWFAENARDLPWRRTKDPYAIWVSEIMLQQTRVPTALPYYERFLRRFPTVRHLARARLDTVLKLWEGLGYYSRARNLHAAAREIVTRFDGQFPRTVEDLLILPGIGRYTAGAIASNAFDVRAPIVDGNIERVLCRIFRVRGDPKSSTVRKTLWSIAEQLVPEENPGLFNQAIMEVGSEVCTPRNPNCDNCPLAAVCEARRHNEQHVLPERRPGRPLPSQTVVVGIITKAGRILIDKRKPEGLLGGLWEFPGGKREPRESLEAALRREVKEELGITIGVGKPLAVVDHTYSHFRVRIHAFECTHVAGKPRCITCADLKWVRPQDLRRYAFPAATNKIIRVLRSKKNRTS